MLFRRVIEGNFGTKLARTFEPNKGIPLDAQAHGKLINNRYEFLRTTMPRARKIGRSELVQSADSRLIGGSPPACYDDEVLPYFRNAECNERGEDQFHGKFGPLSVGEGPSRKP